MSPHAAPDPDLPRDLVVRFARAAGADVPDGAALPGAWAALAAAGIGQPGLAFAAAAEPPQFGHALFSVMANAPDVRTVLAHLDRFHPLAGREQVVSRVTGRRGWIGVVAADGGPAHPDTVDAFFAVLVRTVRSLAGDRAGPERVRLRRPAPPDRSPWEEVFGTVSFAEPADRCEFGPDALDAPVERADPGLLRAVSPYAERLLRDAGRPWAGRVADLVDAGLAEGVTLAEVARALAASPRALQGRLHEEGTTFSAVVDAVQRQRGLALLATTDQPVGAVAAAVGFATPAAFTRAVRRWTGRTPSAYRRAAVTGDAGDVKSGT